MFLLLTLQPNRVDVIKNYQNSIFCWYITEISLKLWSQPREVKFKNSIVLEINDKYKVVVKKLILIM